MGMEGWRDALLFIPPSLHPHLDRLRVQQRRMYANPLDGACTSNHRPVRNLRVLQDDDDPVADVEAGALALLDAPRVRDDAVVADRGVLVDDRVLDARPGADAGEGGPVQAAEGAGLG